MTKQTAIEANPIFEQLAAEFPREDIHWLPKTIFERDGKVQGMALAYVDARDVMDRLDDVCGPDGWQDSYEETARGRIVCTISILIAGDWISKSDGAGDTAVEGDKGALSDAFKRAAVKWGIGRYLYRLPTVWAEVEPRTNKDGIVRDKNGKPFFKKWKNDPWLEVPNDWQARKAKFGPRQNGDMSDTDLKGALRTICQTISKTESKSDLDSFLADEWTQDATEQAKRRAKPWWFTGAGLPEEWVPIEQQINAKYAQFDDVEPKKKKQPITAAG